MGKKDTWETIKFDPNDLKVIGSIGDTYGMTMGRAKIVLEMYQSKGYPKSIITTRKSGKHGVLLLK